MLWHQKVRGFLVQHRAEAYSVGSLLVPSALCEAEHSCQGQVVEALDLILVLQ
jgi:hypothetical protein